MEKTDVLIKDAESYSKSITGAKERKSNIGVDIGYHNSNAEVILYFRTMVNILQ